MYTLCALATLPVPGRCLLLETTHRHITSSWRQSSVHLKEHTDGSQVLCSSNRVTSSPLLPSAVLPSALQLCSTRILGEDNLESLSQPFLDAKLSGA